LWSDPCSSPEPRPLPRPCSLSVVSWSCILQIEVQLLTLRSLADCAYSVSRCSVERAVQNTGEGSGARRSLRDPMLAKLVRTFKPSRVS
ncbi:unnamed protein product, partial [Ectocarpus sp. 8 AP-2014]